MRSSAKSPSSKAEPVPIVRKSRWKKIAQSGQLRPERRIISRHPRPILWQDSLNRRREPSRRRHDMTRNIGKARIDRLQAGLRERGIDALIAMKPESSFYLSGFNPIIYS